MRYSSTPSPENAILTTFICELNSLTSAKIRPLTVLSTTRKRGKNVLIKLFFRRIVQLFQSDLT
jgi:hypothetical protein